MAILITDPSYSAFLSDFNTTLPSFDSALRDQMWDLFLHHFGYVDSNGNLVTGPDLSAFNTFLMTRLLANAPSFYSSALTSLWLSQLSSVQEEELWQEFLDAQGLVSDPT